ncbi:hypothetical protein GS8_899 [Geobacillus stearothermophilus]|uniref:Uncharacterized protein n=1 Tax=Geobacillus stearothermophilus TaxID=1422 RepID=A0ABQ7HHY2_GEOSE|nr:DUF6176 family protein [Geobacillus stearothermophilus]KAF6511790.1 hypothetical protein GS8_899 [Geobacillus stearothermophilus]
MKVELSKFRVKEGKSKRVDEWMEFRRVDYPIKSKGYRKKSTFPVECE